MSTERERADMAYQLLKDALSDEEAPTLLDRLIVAERDLAEARAALRWYADRDDVNNYVAVAYFAGEALRHD